MSALVPVLLSAIADPNTSTRPCLDTLLSTTFVNTIDAPSLALVVPVVHRGLRDRSGDTKKRAARIVGNMCSLTTPKVWEPRLTGCWCELVDQLVIIRTVEDRTTIAVFYRLQAESSCKS